MKKLYCLFALSVLISQYINAYESPASLLDLKNHSEIDYYTMLFSKHNYYISKDTIDLRGIPRYKREFSIVQAEYPNNFCCDYEVGLKFTPKSRLVYEVYITGVSSKKFVRGLLSFYNDLTKIYGQPDSACYRPGYLEQGEMEYFPVSMIGNDTTNVKKFFEQAKPFVFFWANEHYRIELTTNKSYTSMLVSDFECTIKDKKVYETYLSEVASIEDERQASEKINYIIKVVLAIIGCIVIFFLGRFFIKAYKKSQEEYKAWQDAEEAKRIKKQKYVDNRNEEYKIQLIGKYGTITRILSNTCYDNELIKQYDDIYVFEEHKKIVISKKEYDFSDILSCSMYDDNHKDVPPIQVTKTDTGSMLGRAAVGALTLGVAGAVVGAVTAKKESTSKFDANYEGSYIVKIGIKKIEEPTITLRFGSDKSKAEEVYALMQAIIAMK